MRSVLPLVLRCFTLVLVNTEPVCTNDVIVSILNSPVTQCYKPWSYIPDGIMPVFWRVVYWTSQCLTWSEPVHCVVVSV